MEGRSFVHYIVYQLLIVSDLSFFSLEHQSALSFNKSCRNNQNKEPIVGIDNNTYPLEILNSSCRPIVIISRNCLEVFWFKKYLDYNNSLG